MKHIKKADLFLILGVLIVALVCVLVFASDSPGSYVEVSLDGIVIARYPLDKDRVILFGAEGSTNELIIEHGSAYIRHADCPDKICTKFPKISREGENILCVPHRLAFTVVGGDTGVDAVLSLPKTGGAI